MAVNVYGPESLHRGRHYRKTKSKRRALSCGRESSIIGRVRRLHSSKTSLRLLPVVDMQLPSQTEQWLSSWHSMGWVLERATRWSSPAARLSHQPAVPL